MGSFPHSFAARRAVRHRLLGALVGVVTVGGVLVGASAPAGAASVGSPTVTVTPAVAGAANARYVVEFTLAGQRFTALNGGPVYTFTPAVSFVVGCTTQEEVDHYWYKLSDGGDLEAQQCGWLKDRFGLSWQIVPAQLGEYMSDRDPEKAGRTMQAMLKMKKLDIAELKAAHDGA